MSNYLHFVPDSTQDHNHFHFLPCLKVDMFQDWRSTDRVFVGRFPVVGKNNHHHKATLLEFQNYFSIFLRQYGACEGNIQSK